MSDPVSYWNTEPRHQEICPDTSNYRTVKAIESRGERMEVEIALNDRLKYNVHITIYIVKDGCMAVTTLCFLFCFFLLERKY